MQRKRRDLALRGRGAANKFGRLAAVHYLCVKARDARRPRRRPERLQHGERIQNRAQMPLRSVVALQCRADVRMFRRRRPPHGIRLGGLGGRRSRGEPPGKTRRTARPQLRGARNASLRPYPALRIHHSPHPSRRQRHRRHAALRHRDPPLLRRAPAAHREAEGQPVVGGLDRAEGREAVLLAGRSGRKVAPAGKFRPRTSPSREVPAADTADAALTVPTADAAPATPHGGHGRHDPTADTADAETQRRGTPPPRHPQQKKGTPRGIWPFDFN